MGIKQLARQYFKLEEQIRDGLGKLKNDGNECDCDDCDKIQFIHDGNHFDEIESYCLNCGGYVENPV
jgi:hypothetical protein